jgi:hypothetical protein
MPRFSMTFFVALITQIDTVRKSRCRSRRLNIFTPKFAWNGLDATAGRPANILTLHFLQCQVFGGLNRSCRNRASKGSAGRSQTL